MIRLNSLSVPSLSVLVAEWLIRTPCHRNVPGLIPAADLRHHTHVCKSLNLFFLSPTNHVFPPSLCSGFNARLSSGKQIFYTLFSSDLPLCVCECVCRQQLHPAVSIQSVLILQSVHKLNKNLFILKIT